MIDSCCLHFHYSLDLTFLFVTFSEEKKKQQHKNVKNSVSSCSVSHESAFLKTHVQEKKVDNKSHKNTLKLLSSPLVHFTSRFLQGTKFTPHCLHSVINASDHDKVCLSGSLIHPPKKLSKITGGKPRAL